MISTITWVPRGSCARVPKKFVPSAAELEMMHSQASQPYEEEVPEDEDIDDAELQAMAAAMDDDRQPNDDDVDASGLPASFKMEDYDNELAVDEEDEENDMMDTATEVKTDTETEPLEEEEDEDLEIRETDSIILVGTTDEEEYSSIEVQIYDEVEGDLYVHHEVTLPSFPLSTCFLNVAKDVMSGAFVAVGTFKPEIEIWDLDVLDALEPVLVLSSGGGHSDAVMCLDWNTSHRNMLLSGSADSDIILWDVSTGNAMHKFSDLHCDKVQSVLWRPTESTIFASASYNSGTVVITDGSNPSKASRVISIKESNETTAAVVDPECMAWNPFKPTSLVVGLENGSVAIIESVVDSGAGNVTFLQAHEKALSGLAFSSSIPNLFATCSVDKTVSIWNIETRDCVVSKEMAVGELFSIGFCMDSPFTLATGGQKGILAVWDTSESSAIEKHFASQSVPDGIKNDADDVIARSLKTPDEVAEELMQSMDISSTKKSAKKSKKSKKNKKN